MPVNKAFEHELEEANENPDDITGFEVWDNNSQIRNRMRLQSVVEPEQVTQSYLTVDKLRDYSSFDPSDANILRKKDQSFLDEFRDKYVIAAEKAWSINRGQVPIEFYLQFSTEDLDLMGMVPAEAVAEMEYQEELAGMEQARIKAVEDEVEKRVEEARTQHSLKSGAQAVASGLVGLPSVFSDFDEDAVRAQAQLEVEAASTGTPIYAPESFGEQIADTIMQISSTGLSVLGGAFDFLTEVASPLMEMTPGYKLMFEPLIMDPIIGDLANERDEKIAEIREASGTPLDQAKLVMWHDSRRAWEAAPSETKDLYTQRADGNQLLGMGLFINDLQDTPEAEEQLSGLVDQITTMQADAIQEVREGDLSQKNDAMAFLAAWGNFTGDLAVGTMLFASNDDIRSQVLDGEVGSFWESIQSFDHSPAKLLGWDGTALGIATDFGAMALFDPTTYVFGGGAASAAGRGTVRTAAQIDNLVASPATTNMIDDITIRLASPDTGLIETISHTGLDPVAIEQLLEIRGWNPQVFKRGDDFWRKNYPLAREIPTSELTPLIPGDFISNTAAVTAQVNKRGGFKRPVEIEVTTSGRVRINEFDHNAVVAATEQNWDALPVRVNVVDDVEGLLKRNGVDPQENVVYHGTSKEVAASIDHFDEGVDIGGFTDDIERALEFAGEDGVVQVFRRGEDGPFPTEQGASIGAIEENPALLDDLAPSQQIDIFPEGGFTPDAVLDAADVSKASKVDDVGWTFLDDAYGGRAHIPEKIGPNQSPATMFDPGINAGVTKEAVERVVRGHLERNGRLNNQANTAVVRGMQSFVDTLSKNGNFFQTVHRLFTQANLQQIWSGRGLGAFDQAFDFVLRLWGDDAAGANKWAEKIVTQFQKQGATRGLIRGKTDELQKLQGEAAALQAKIPEGQWEKPFIDDAIDFAIDEGVNADEVIRQTLEGQRAARANTKTELVKVNKKIEAIRDESAKARNTLPKDEDIGVFLDEMIDDYIDTYIMNDPTWQKFIAKNPGVLDENGRISRAFLSKGRVDTTHKVGPITEATRLADDVATRETAAAQKLVGHTEASGYDLGVSMLDLLVARSRPGSKYTQFTQAKAGHFLRQAGHQLNYLWVVDKVLRPATAAVVTVDEAMRILHLYGMPALDLYVKDKGINTAARAANAWHTGVPISPKGFFAKEAVPKGAQYLPAKAQERIRRLQDFPDLIKRQERNFFDAHGVGYVDIMPDNPLYQDAAQRWASGWMQDEGFRAFLSGPEEFAKWWEGPSAVPVRDKVVAIKTENGRMTSAKPSMEQVRQGYETMWAIFTKPARKNGSIREFEAAWKSTAEEITTNGGRPVALPTGVLNDWIPVRGTQKVGSQGIGGLTEPFFDRLFMEPVNYRRGFIADLVRTTERERLAGLYADLGKTIVPDSKLSQLMDVAGYETPLGPGSIEALQHVWADSKYVPESFVSQTIEKTVQREIENVLYNWNQGSVAGGRVAPAIYPFGKPYADMMGFWGREMMKTPVLRGYLTKDNYFNMQGIADSLPFNPKTGALLSRMAATDFHVDRGWVPFDGNEQEGLLPGSDETDLSPIFFLPTEGDDIVGVLGPGMGFIPLALLDLAVNHFAPDPIEDPIGYKQVIDGVSEVSPFFGFQQGGLVSRTLGGGTINTAFELGVDFIGYLGGQTFFNVTSELGDIGRETRRAREVGTILSDPEEWEALESLETKDQVDAFFADLVSEANKAASLSHGAETLTRSLLPAQTQFDTTSAELQSVWITASNEFPEFLEVQGPYNEDTEEGRRAKAADIRDAFFKLDNWQKDAMVTANPTLAVNLVSSWDWTPKAINEVFPGTDKAYSTGGEPENLLRHDYYVQHAFVRPVQPTDRVRLITGQVGAARESSIKFIYEEVAKDVNDIVWEEFVVGTRIEPFLEQIVEDYGVRLGVADARQLWSHWHDMEAEIIAIERAAGETHEDESLGMPDDAKPWSTTWPGFDKTSRKFANLQNVTLNEKARQVVEMLDLEVEDGMSGEEFHKTLVQPLTQNEAIAYAVTRAPWDTYLAERGTTRLVASAELQKAKFNELNDESWRRGLIEWEHRVDGYLEQYEDAPQGIPPHLRQEVMDDYMWLMATTGDGFGMTEDGKLKRGGSKIPFDSIWEGKYQRTFGDLGWTPPEPSEPLDENGVVGPYTFTPLIKDIVDGDTIVYQETRGGPMHQVRLLGVNAREFANDVDGAREDTTRLQDAIEQARVNNDTIYFVTDPDRFVTQTDKYGRLLAWLWVGDKPFYFKEEFIPRFTPSGGD